MILMQRSVTFDAHPQKPLVDYIFKIPMRNKLFFLQIDVFILVYNKCFYSNPAGLTRFYIINSRAENLKI